jgi:hypothetical protein
MMYQPQSIRSIPAFQYVFSTIYSTTTATRAECSSLALQTSVLPVKTQRASGFVFNKTTSTCTLGRTTAYNDYFMNNGIVEDEAADVYIMIGKPLGINLIYYFYLSFNIIPMKSE